MDRAEHPSRQATLSDYLAVERTTLAWIRTGLALMGFGFVVSRYGIFLEELRGVQSITSTHPRVMPTWLGIALIAAGVFVHLVAGVHYHRLVGKLDRGLESESHHSPQALVITFLLALVGLSMVVYLISAQRFVQPQSAIHQDIGFTPHAEQGVVSAGMDHFAVLSRHC